MRRCAGMRSVGSRKNRDVCARRDGFSVVAFGRSSGVRQSHKTRNGPPWRGGGRRGEFAVVVVESSPEGVVAAQRDNAARCECGCGRSPVGASVKRSPKARPEPATTPLGNGAGTGDEPKTTAVPDTERLSRSGNATGRAGRQGHANQGTPNQRGVSGTPRRGTQIKAPTNA